MVIFSAIFQQNETLASHKKEVKTASLYLAALFNSQPGTILYSDWENDEWNYQFKGTFVYNLSGLETESTTYEYVDGNWNPVSKKGTEYNVQGQIVKEVLSVTESPQPTSKLKNGVTWIKYSETRFTYDEEGTQISKETYLYPEGTETLYSGIKYAPIIYDTSDRITEISRQIYTLGPGWRIDKKNVYSWNTSDEFDEISQFIYNGDPTPP